VKKEKTGPNSLPRGGEPFQRLDRDLLLEAATSWADAQRTEEYRRGHESASLSSPDDVSC
jgi:hypothetical protein